MQKIRAQIVHLAATLPDDIKRGWVDPEAAEWAQMAEDAMNGGQTEDAIEYLRRIDEVLAWL